MAIDTYGNTKYQSSFNQSGDELTAITKIITVTAADATDGDLYRVAILPLDAVVTRVTIGTTALTSAVDNDFGLYVTNSGAAADADILMDGQTLAAASKVLDGLQTVSVANATKTLRELYLAINTSGTAFAHEKYCDLGLVINTKSTADGSISVKIEYHM